MADGPQDGWYLDPVNELSVRYLEAGAWTARVQARFAPPSPGSVPLAQPTTVRSSPPVRPTAATARKVPTAPPRLPTLPVSPPASPSSGSMGRPPGSRWPVRKGELFAALGAVVLIGVVMAVVSSSHKGDTSPRTTASSVVLPVPGTSPRSVYATAVPVPTVLVSLSGNGRNTTLPFTAKGSWNLQWSYNCAGFSDGTGNFQVYVLSASSATKVTDEGPNQLGATGSSTTYMPQGGTLILKMTSECDWSVKAVGYR